MESNSGALRPSISNALGDQNVRLPLSVSADDLAVILDADGNAILVVDMNREREDDEVAAIAILIADAVNTAAGMPVPATVEQLRVRIDRLTDPDHRVVAAELRAIAAEKRGG